MVRASLGSAGGRPRFDAQYETYAVASGGILSANTRGNTRLGPEVTVEQEYGVDAELFARVGITLNYSRAVTRDQILLVPPPLHTPVIKSQVWPARHSLSVTQGPQWPA